MRAENESKWIAVLNNPRDGAACRELLQSGFDPNARLGRDEPALMQAAGRGQLETCKILIAAGADVKLGDEQNRTSLHLAAANGHDDVCKLLIAHGAAVDAETYSDGGTPLHWASGRAPAAKVLLAAGASVHTRNKWDMTPLHKAVQANDEEVCRLLLTAGADPIIRPDDCRSGYATPLEAAVSKGSGAITQLLAEGREIDFFQPNVDGVALIDLKNENADEQLVTFLADLCAQKTEHAILEGLDPELQGEPRTSLPRASFSPM